MKPFYLITLLTLACCVSTLAQSNVLESALPARGTNAETHIDSNHAEFDLAARRAVYQGNVRVNDPQLRLTCELLTVELPQSGGRPEHLIARTNVVMDSVDEKGGTNHATSDMAIYDYIVKDGVTNEIITLSGHARAENSQVILYGEPITYNRQTGSLTAQNQHMIIKQILSSALVSTNPPVAGTNDPPGTNRIPVLNTNRPPPP